MIKYNASQTTIEDPAWSAPFRVVLPARVGANLTERHASLAGEPSEVGKRLFARVNGGRLKGSNSGC
jgi:hypothetical protein